MAPSARTGSDGTRSRRHRSFAFAVLGAGLLAANGAGLATGCGARTELWNVGGGSPTTAGTGGGAAGHGAGAASPDAGDDASPPDAGPPDASPPDASLPICRLQAAELPVVVHGYDDRDLHTPSAVVVSPGAIDPATGTPLAPARVALQTVSSNNGSTAPDGIELGLLELWAGGAPQSIDVAEPFFLLGDGSLTYAQMARAPGLGASELALTWYGESGTELGLVSTAPWGVSSVSTILSAEGSTPLAFAAGAGVGPWGVGYDGLGYGLGWELPGDEGPLVAAVLDAQGTVALGPHSVLGAAPASGAAGPSIHWSGEAYLLATGVTDCYAQDPLCVSHAVVLSRIRPASGDAVDDSGIDLAGALGALEPTAEMGYASLAASGGSIAVAWLETVPSPTQNPRWSLRMTLLGPAGAPLGAPVLVAEDTTLTHSVRSSGGSAGLVTVRAEEGDLALPENTPGRSRLVVYQRDSALEPLAGPIPIAATQFGSYGFPAAVALDAPRGLLVVWSARHPDYNRRAIFAAFMPCVP